MNQNKKISTKIIIMIPVFILGIVSIFSNVWALRSLGNVNSAATVIADKSMSSVSKLADVEQETMQIHNLALSHIIATDLNAMIGLVEEIRNEEDTLEQSLDDYEAYTESRGWVFDDPLEYMPGEHMYNMQDFENFILDIKNGKDNYKEQRASVRAKTHNVCDNYCQRVLDYFNITM